MSSIDEVRARVDIVDLVSETVQLRKAGRNYTGFCPFHPNSRTPAFVVFPESGTWRCFGACNEGGDAFRFLMKKEGWDFGTALRQLAERVGVKLEPLTPQREARNEEFERLQALLEDAVTFYHHHLTSAPGGKAALAYLHKRGLTQDTIQKFGLGYAPDGWDNFLRYSAERKVTPQDLLDAGLVSERESGGYYDRFRNRIMFPIRNALGKMAGFGARILNPEDVPKFLNSPQTVLFDKGRLLYGMDQARRAIRSADQAVIVEGYLDVIALHQAGFENTISPMGTALSEDQLRQLKRFTRRIVLALDPDTAGQRATLRGLEVTRQAMDQETEISFDSRGLIRNEGRMQADIRVTMLPDQRDPDEIALADPEAWGKIVAEARPVVVHVMETLAEGQDLTDAKVKNEIAAQVLPLINDVASPIERDSYRQRLARLLRVDERVLVSGAPAARRRAPRARARTNSAPVSQSAADILPVNPVQAMEGLCLRLLVRDPERLHGLNRLLQEAGLARLSMQDFEDAAHQMLARLVMDALNQDEQDAGEFIAGQVSEDLRALYDELVAPWDKGDPGSEEAFIQLFRTVLRIRERHIRENLEQFRQMAILASDQEEKAGSLDMNARLVVDFNMILKRIDSALKRPVLLN